jgi:hypothetical protein
MSNQYEAHKAGLSLFPLGFSRWCDALRLILFGFLGVLSAFSTHYFLHLEIIIKPRLFAGASASFPTPPA